MKLLLKKCKNYLEKFRLVERHKNPLVIFLRIPIYLFLFYSIWNHYLLLILVGIGLEIANWTLVPPVNKTWGLIEKIVQNELLWLEAKMDSYKLLSLLFLSGAMMVLPIGLWKHSLRLIMIGFALMITFNLLMNFIVKKEKRTEKM